MSKAATSPTARLLQTSRLFSLPRPLPQPLNDTLTSSGLHRGSDSATLPYPTHQAITTTPASLHRGDYGLKRALPARRLRRTATPHVRINAQDTFEHITDFSSAANHTQSERKWAEMGVPMLQRPNEASSGSASARVSVYEAWLDNTDPQARPVESTTPSGGFRRSRDSDEVKRMQRWKYDGPFIPGMQEGDFRKWLDTLSEKRRGEWREFVRERETDSRVSEAQRKALERGESEPMASLRGRLRPDDAELANIEKELRDLHSREKLSSSLTRLMTEFLDLPTIHRADTSSRPHMATPGMENFRRNLDVDISVNGPPTTHPGAGLSFLRSNAIMANHPLFGPQSGNSPIETRVIRPRISANGPRQRHALLGVGGFVTEDPQTATLTSPGLSARQRNQAEADRMTEYMDENLEGGNKLWVQTKSAYVDDKGNIRLDVGRADPEALVVKRGGKELQAIIEAKMVGSGGMPAARRGPVGNPFGL